MIKWPYKEDLKLLIKENATEKDFLEAGFTIDIDPDYEDTYILKIESKRFKNIVGGYLSLGTIFREVDSNKNYLLFHQNTYYTKNEWEIFMDLFDRLEKLGFLIGYKED